MMPTTAGGSTDDDDGFMRGTHCGGSSLQTTDSHCVNRDAEPVVASFAGCGAAFDPDGGVLFHEGTED